MLLHLRGASVKRSGSPRPRRTVLAPRITVTLLSNTSARVDWQFQNSVDADEVVIWRSIDGTTYAEVTTETAGSSGSFTATDLAADTCYWWRVQGVIPYGVGKTLTSGFSNVEIKTTTDTTPALVQPTFLSITQTGLTEDTYTVTASWTAVANADGYYYYFAPSGDGGFEDADVDDPNDTVLTSVTGIAISRGSDNDVSELHVMAVNASGRGSEALLQFVIPGNLKAPNLLPLDVTGNDVAVSWIEDPGADSAVFNLLERDDGDGFVLIATIAAGTAAPQYEDEDLANGVYVYRVQALDNSQLDEETGDPIEKLSGYSTTQTAHINVSVVVPPDLGQDFEAMTSIGDLDPAWNNRAPTNIVFDDGTLTPHNEVGLLYRYIARPTHCADQALFLEIDTPAQMEVWTEQTAVISAEFTTINPFCTTIPNYKLSIGHLRPLVAMLSGRARFEVQMGQGVEGRNMGATGTGYPTFTSEAEVTNPLAFLTPSPIDATTLSDGGRHVIRTYWRLFLDPIDSMWKETMIQSVDGSVTHAYTAFAGNPGSASLSRMSLGGARSMGAEVEMYICQKSYWIWYAGNDPGWFTGINPTDYT